MSKKSLQAVSVLRRGIVGLAFSALAGIAVAQGAGGATAGGSSEAVASFPSKPIRLIVPYPPGGPTDLMARIVALEMSKTLGQNVLIENKPGASGMIGAEQVAHATGDGYTILCNASLHVINPSLYAKMRYDSIKDFAPITQLADVPLVLVVNNDLPIKTVADLVTYAKSAKPAISFASSGNASAQQLAGESFKIAAHVDMQHIPYKGSTPALTDVMGGQVQLMFDSMPSAMPYIRGGKLRAIATTTAKRASGLPELPTIAESGFPGFDISTWYALWAPAGTPKTIVEKLSSHAAMALKTPEVRKQYADLGAEPVGSTPTVFSAYIDSETKKWEKIVRASGAKPD